MTGYLGTLDEAKRQKVFGVMRRLRDQAMADQTRATELTPPNGTIGVGSEHVRLGLLADARHTFLTALATKMTIAEAIEAGTESGRQWATKWNARKDRVFFSHQAETNIWPETAAAMLQDDGRAIAAAAAI